MAKKVLALRRADVCAGLRGCARGRSTGSVGRGGSYDELFGLCRCSDRLSE